MKQVLVTTLLGMYICTVMTVKDYIPLKYQNNSSYTVGGGFARIIYPEKTPLKDSANLKLIFDEEGQPLAHCAGNT